jgi:hypothetical protein
MRVLLEMKRQISWQEHDLNICSQDLNQLVASKLELPRKRPGTGRTETTENIGNPRLGSNWQKDLYQGPLPEERRICWN